MSKIQSQRVRASSRAGLVVGATALALVLFAVVRGPVVVAAPGDERTGHPAVGIERIRVARHEIEVLGRGAREHDRPVDEIRRVAAVQVRDFRRFRRFRPDFRVAGV